MAANDFCLCQRVLLVNLNNIGQFLFNPHSSIDISGIEIAGIKPNKKAMKKGADFQNASTEPLTLAEKMVISSNG